ncbi:hypothetical protein KKG46_02100 [Patescibacteria group bacterium]|nr:hypothetical protein [Patescibacteria group bacterium]
MELNYNPPLLSRIILAVSALIAVGVIFVFVSRALEPVPQPPLPPLRQADSFNPKADISQNSAFHKLQTKDMVAVPDLPMGRENPFIAIKKTTSTQNVNSITSTSTIPVEGIPLPGTTISIVPSEPISSPTSTLETTVTTTTSTYEPTNP